MIDRGELIRKLALNAARFSFLAPVAGRYFRGVGAILMLHRVTDRPGGGIGLNRHLTIAPSFLDEVLAEARRLGCVFVSMDEAVERLRGGATGERFVAVTADDAYRDNLIEALPVLERHEAPITIYAAPGLVEGRAVLWWDVVERIVTCRETVSLNTRQGPKVFACATFAEKLRANRDIHDYLTGELPEEEQIAAVRDLAAAHGVAADAMTREVLMDWDELRRAAAHPLVTIGAHTVSHSNLMRLSAEGARREIEEAAAMLEAALGERPRHMAYPYGYPSAVGPREVALAREAGFVSAVTTRHGLLQAEHARHLHSLPRISVNGRYQRVEHLRTMLSGVTTPIANRGRRVVTV